MAAKKRVFRTFDPAEMLDSPEMIAGYLSFAIEEANGDPKEITRALNMAARAQNMAQLARETGVSREGLYKALSPEGNPSFELVDKLLRSFGLRFTVQDLKTGKRPSSAASRSRTAKPAANVTRRVSAKKQAAAA